MDEPLSNLDAKLRARTRAEIVDLYERLETTFVYVTHDQVEAMTMATRIAILDRGVLQQVGDPRAVYNEPANVFVARFIGSPPMNVVPGTIVSSGTGGTAVEIAGHRLRLGEGWQALEPGTAVQVGVRPEHLAITDAGLEATVVAAEWLGHEQILQLAVGEHRLQLRDAGEGSLPAPGSSLSVAAGADDLHLFDADSGSRLSVTP